MCWRQKRGFKEEAGSLQPWLDEPQILVYGFTVGAETVVATPASLREMGEEENKHEEGQGKQD